MNLKNYMTKLSGVLQPKLILLSGACPMNFPYAALLYAGLTERSYDTGSRYTNVKSRIGCEFLNAPLRFSRLGKGAVAYPSLKRGVMLLLTYDRRQTAMLCRRLLREDIKYNQRESSTG